jgi:hypothetical protein
VNRIHATHFWETALSTLANFIDCRNASDIRMGASSLWRNSNLCVFFPEEQFAEKTMCSSHWSSVHLKMLQTKGLHECTVVDRKEQFDCCNFDEKLCEIS